MVSKVLVDSWMVNLMDLVSSIIFLVTSSFFFKYSLTSAIWLFDVSKVLAMALNCWMKVRDEDDKVEPAT